MFRLFFRPRFALGLVLRALLGDGLRLQLRKLGQLVVRFLRVLIVIVNVVLRIILRLRIIRTIIRLRLRILIRAALQDLALRCTHFREDGSVRGARTGNCRPDDSRGSAGSAGSVGSVGSVGAAIRPNRAHNDLTGDLHMGVDFQRRQLQIDRRGDLNV
jgi:hypothetical protein